MGNHGRRKRCVAFVLSALVLTSATQAAVGCSYMYETSIADDTLIMATTEPQGSVWSWGAAGDDWAGGSDGDGKPWACGNGTQQSPIDIREQAFVDLPGAELPPELQTSFYYPPLVSNGSNVQVTNKGASIEVRWLPNYYSKVLITAPKVPAGDNDDDDDDGANISVTSVLDLRADVPPDAVQRVKATPVQLHFHTGSEHWYNGMQYALEMHLVHEVTDLPGCAAAKCHSIVSVVFQLQDGRDNPLLETIWASLPSMQGEAKFLPRGTMIELAKFLPPAKERVYVMYAGSQTTPPCTEGILWHVMKEPQPISYTQYKQYKAATSFKDCPSVGEPDSARRSHGALAPPDGGDNSGGSGGTCVAGLYSSSARLPQPINGRTIRFAVPPAA